MGNPEDRIKELNSLVREVEKFRYDDKPIPYLGWFWRDAFGETLDPLSLVHGNLWIDEAGKWDYPVVRISQQKSDYIVQLCINVLKEQKLLFAFLDKLKKDYVEELS